MKNILWEFGVGLMIALAIFGVMAGIILLISIYPQFVIKFCVYLVSGIGVGAMILAIWALGHAIRIRSNNL